MDVAAATGLFSRSVFHVGIFTAVNNANRRIFSAGRRRLLIENETLSPRIPSIVPVNSLDENSVFFGVFGSPRELPVFADS